MDLIRESWLGRQLRRAEQTGEAAIRHSRTLSIASAWTARTRANAGIVLVVAAVTHVALVLTQTTAAGWLWLVPPVAAAASGALLLTAATRSAETSA